MHSNILQLIFDLENVKTFTEKAGIWTTGGGGKRKDRKKKKKKLLA